MPISTPRQIAGAVRPAACRALWKRKKSKWPVTQPQRLRDGPWIWFGVSGGLGRLRRYVSSFAIDARRCEHHERTTFGATGGVHGIGRNEDAQWLEADVADPGFEQVVEVSGREVDTVGAGSEKEVPEHRE